MHIQLVADELQPTADRRRNLIHFLVIRPIRRRAPDVQERGYLAKLPRETTNS